MRVIYLPRMNEEVQHMNESNIQLASEGKNKPPIPLIKEPLSTYESWRRYMFNLMERPKTNVATTYHLINFLLIIASMVMSVLATMEPYENDPQMRGLVFYYEIGLLCWFSIEYSIRVWASSFLSKYRGWRGKLRFLKTFYMLVDSFVIVSTFISAVLHIKDAYFPLFRTTRLLQFFRVLHLDRRRGDLRTMARIVSQHKKELVTSYFVGFIILFGGTYIIYICERSADKKGSIDNMADGLYWAMITVTSVGYGDFSPETWAGKMLGGVFALVGCAFFALPAGILGSGFALQVAKQKKQARYRKLRQPAAIAIQNFWRYYSVRSDKDHLNGTWKKYFPNARSSIIFPSEMVRETEDEATQESFESVSSSQSEQGGCSRRPSKDVLNEANVEDRPLIIVNEEDKPLIAGQDEVSFKSDSSSSIVSSLTPVDIDPFVQRAFERNFIGQATKEYKNAVKTEIDVRKVLHRKFKGALKFLLRCKFNVAIRSFKNVRYPFVNMQDIMEKGSHRHSEITRYLHDIKKQFSTLHKEMQDLRSSMELLKLEMNKIGPLPRKGNRTLVKTHLANELAEELDKSEMH